MGNFNSVYCSDKLATDWRDAMSQIQSSRTLTLSHLCVKDSVLSFQGRGDKIDFLGSEGDWIWGLQRTIKSVDSSCKLA